MATPEENPDPWCTSPDPEPEPEQVEVEVPDDLWNEGV